VKRREQRVSKWVRSQAPTRESFERNRFLSPFAHRVFAPELWRFTRRSVPRGVALGLLVGIFLLIPGLQIVGAALLALPFRANIPIAAAMTFLSNPLTTPFILAASLFIGEGMLKLGGDPGRLTMMMEKGASMGDWLAWTFSEGAPALVAGLAAISALMAVIGYFLAVVLWRWWIGRKWLRRGHHWNRPLS
jgi:uncharacterized protein (DUF2062 family)